MELGQAFMQPGLMDAQTQLAQSQATGNQLKIAQQQNLQKIMQQFQAGMPSQSGKPMNMADKLDSAADLIYRSGDIVNAAKYSSEASKLRKNSSDLLKNEASTELSQARTQNAQFDLTRRMLGSVNDQASLDRFNMIYQGMTGLPSPIAGQAYSRDLVGSALDQMLEGEGKQTNARRQRLVNIADANVAIRDRDSRIREDHYKVMEGIDRDREDRLQKTGGGNIKSPSKADQDAASELITSAYPDYSIAGKKLAARDIASRAKVIMARNPGVDASQALHRAFLEAQSNGSFENEPGFWGGTSKNLKYAYKEANAGTERQPLKMEADPAKRKIGAYYTAPNGNTYQWLKGGWRQATTAPKAGSFQSYSSASSADEEDDGTEENPNE